MKIIGLTGPTGAGKGEVSRVWASLGAKIIDCDAVYHEMLKTDAPLRAELAQAFPACTDSAGTIDRRKLAGVVFGSKDALHTLESIAYRHICRKISEELDVFRQNGTEIAVLDAPTLFEAGADTLCDLCAAVLAPVSIRRERLRERDGLDDAAIDARIAAQKSDDFFRTHCTCILENNAGLDALREAAKAAYYTF